MAPNTNAIRMAKRLGALGLRLLGSTLLCASAPVAAAPAPSAPARPASEQGRPNLIVILADDLGYSDIGAYGGDIDTPNLDELARHSLKFANFYNMSRCCPSRASLLTGRYPHRVGMPGNGTSLSLDVPTVAEELRDSGYATTMVGKWHLTAAVPLKDPAEQLKWLNHQAYGDRDFGDRRTYPAARGFQHHWGIIWGIADYYDPFSLVNDFTPVKSVPKGFYLTDAISDHAADEVIRLGKGGSPFMMYLAYTAAHWPLMAPETTIQKYLPRYQAGWDRMRQDRYARQLRLGIVNASTDRLPPTDSSYENNAGTAWVDLTPPQREQQVRKMATHAAMVDIMDQGIGRVIKALKASGKYDNTVIMFMSDNGASPEVMVEPGYDRPSETRDGRPIGYGEYPKGGIGTEQTMAGIGARWASAANTPWRYWKAESYQGGVHTPFFISWPGHLGKREGSTIDAPAHVIDVTPTLLELAGVKPHLAGKPAMDGMSLAGTLAAAPLPGDRPLYFEHYGARAIIEGRWKLVSLAPGPRHPPLPWSLYDLKSDRTETSDIAKANPQIVARLDSKWAAWAKAVGVPKRDGRAPPVRPAPINGTAASTDAE